MSSRSSWMILCMAAGFSVASCAAAKETETSAAVDAHAVEASASGKPVFVQDVAAEARDAISVVDAFGAAIKAADLAVAKDLLDVNALVLESGESERSRDEYMGSHAIADAAFMQSTVVTPRYRRARAQGDLAWVGTQSELERTKDGKPTVIYSSETMVLRKTGAGWKIVHIHWSSHGVAAGE